MLKPPFRRTLLSASAEFICKYWRHPELVQDYRIGEAIRNARIVANGLTQTKTEKAPR